MDSPSLLILFSYIRNQKKNSSTRKIRLTVGQMPIKTGWRDASLALRDFSQSNKHCIHLSTTKAIYFSRFIFAISAFAQIKISYSNFNKSAAKVWICLVPLLFFSWLSLRHVFFVQAQTKTVEEWWSKWLHCHMYLLQNHHFLLHHLNFQYFFHWIYSALKHLLIIYVIDMLTKNKM